MNRRHDRISNSLQLDKPNQTYVPAVVTNIDVPRPIAVSDGSVGLDALSSALWERKVTIIVVAILGVLLGILVTRVKTPVYRARASLQLEGFNNDQFLHEVAAISPSLPNASPESYLQNEVKLLESETLAKRVADRLGIRADDESETASPVVSQIEEWFPFLRGARLTPEERRVQKVQKALTVRTSLQSQVIELFYDAFDPARAAQGANDAAAEFVNLNREARLQLAKDTTEWLNNQAANLKGSLDRSNQELQDFARSAGLVFAGKASTLAEDRVRQAQDALAKAQADRAAKEARYETAKADPNALLSDALASGPLHQFQTDLQGLRRELAQLQTVYTPSNQKVRSIQAQIAETERAIELERQDALARLHNEYLAADGLERMLSQSQSASLKTVEQQMDYERRYDAKKSEIDATQRLYESMLDKVKEAGAAATMRTTNVRMIDSANPPSVPYSPNPMLNMAVGLGMGTLCGIVLALVRIGSDNKVKRPGESGPLKLRELGVVPSADTDRALLTWERQPAKFPGRVRELTIPPRDQDASLWGESFRAVLTSILFSEGFHREGHESQHEGRVLVVTSTDVMEGKTTMVANLGYAAAERKLRVLLIDADLRRPSLHTRLGVSNDRGLAELLEQGFGDVGGTALDDLVSPTRIPNLWVLSSGSVEGATSSLLYSNAKDLGTLFQRFREDFDLVIIDTPPMRLYADGRLLGRMSDGLVLVVRANRIRREDLSAAYLQLAQDNIPVVGMILNDWKMASSDVRAYKRYQKSPRPAVSVVPRSSPQSS
jgi:capsular exopolysaccharide synthesis family protein